MRFSSLSKPRSRLREDRYFSKYTYTANGRARTGSCLLVNEQEGLLQQLKQLSRCNSQLQWEQRELNSELNKVTLSRRKTEHFISDFQSMLESSYPKCLPEEKNILFKLKAKLLQVERESDDIRRKIAACKRELHSFSVNRFISEEIDQLRSALGQSKAEGKKAAQFKAECCLLDQQILSQRILREKKQREYEAVAQRLKARHASLAQELRTMEELRIQTQKASEAEVQEDVDTIEDVRFKVEEKRRQLSELRDKTGLMARVLEDIERNNNASITALQSQLEQLQERHSLLGRKVALLGKEPAGEELVLTGENLLLMRRAEHTRIAPVGFGEVRAIGENFNIVCTYRGVTVASFVEELLSGNKNRRMSVEEIAQRLGRPPFSLEGEASLLTARYFVEDNKFRKVVFDKEAQASVAMIRSIFEKLVGRVQFQDRQVMRRVYLDLKRNFEKMEYVLTPLLLNKSKVGCSRADVVAMFEGAITELSREELKLLPVLLYALSRDLERVDPRAVLKLKDPDFWETYMVPTD